MTEINPGKMANDNQLKPHYYNNIKKNHLFCCAKLLIHNRAKTYVTKTIQQYCSTILRFLEATKKKKSERKNYAYPKNYFAQKLGILG